MTFLQTRPTAARRARGQTRCWPSGHTHGIRWLRTGKSESGRWTTRTFRRGEGGPSCVAGGDTKWRSRPRDGVAAPGQVKLPVPV